MYICTLPSENAPVYLTLLMTGTLCYTFWM